MRHTLAFLMAFQVLFSSTGLAFYEHSCLMTERTHLSYEQEEGCCDHGEVVTHENLEVPQLKQGLCCETDLAFEYLETNSSSVFGPDFSLFMAIFVLEPRPSVFDNPHSLTVEKHLLFPRMNAPPRSGRDILNLTCLLRI